MTYRVRGDAMKSHNKHNSRYAKIDTENLLIVAYDKLVTDILVSNYAVIARGRTGF